MAVHGTAAARVCTVAMLLALTTLSGVLAKDPVHILYLTDCTMYSDWQTVGMAFSFKNSGQKGHITRVMCCTDEEKAKYNKEMLELMPSHVAPSFAYNERTKDHYAAFNKPGAVLDFMTKGTPLADYMLVIDSDMLLRHPFRPDIYNMTPGKAISADYTYMIGCTNDLAVRHIPEIPVRKDTLAGPMNRYCDMVGGYTFMGREDLTKVAPLWLSVTEDVRQDPEAWRLSGDQYVEKGGKPWISEMYGYSFACAKSNVWHTWDTHVMHYPTYTPQGVPKLMHYGLLFQVDDYQFDKHWHYGFDVAKCPPWDLTGVKDRKGGLFPHPPRPHTLRQKDNPLLYFRDLLSVETVATINAGLCHYHMSRCPASTQLLDECTVALNIYKETMAALRLVEVEMAKSKGIELGADITGAPAVGPATEELEAGLLEVARKLAEEHGKADAGSPHQPDNSHQQPHEEQKQEQQQEQQQQQAQADVVKAQEEQAQKYKDMKLKAIKAAETKAVLSQYGQQASTGDTPEKKRLAVTCHRMAMSLEEVAACLKAANDGKPYQRQRKLLIAKQPSDDGATLPQEHVVHQTAHHQDPEELRVVHRPHTAPATYQLGPWEVLGIWLLCVLMMMVFVPRWVVRLRRRLKTHTTHFE